MTSATLEKYARLSRSEIEGLQFKKIRRQLERAFAHNEFYRAHFAKSGATLDSIKSLADFSARIPTCTKDDFLQDQKQHPPFGKRLGVNREDVALINMTGGTSGQGQEVYGRTNHDIVIQGFLHYFPWYIAGLRPGHLALNGVPTGGFTTGGWGPPEGFRVAGATALNAGGVMSTDAKLDMLERFPDVAFMYCSTNYLHTLTDAFRRRGKLPREVLPKMAGLFIAGEGYPEEWARDIREAWGCALHEGYGSTQGAGFIASSCEKGVVCGDKKPSLLHFIEWENFVEIVDPDTGKHVAPGEEGEMVLTNLSILGSPVIRFATRDKARFMPHKNCTCGRPWNCIEAGNIARYDDMLKIRGNNVWPATVDTVMFSHPQVAEYAARVYVDDKGRTEVDVRYAIKSDAGAAADFTEKLRTQIKEKTNLAVNLALVPVQDLPTFTYKARRWTDERKAGYAAGKQ